MPQLSIDFDQPRERTRVIGRIAPHVQGFVASKAGQQFHMAELLAYVNEHAAGAPGSPERILRDLRQRGLVKYRVVDRAASLYEAE